MYWQLGILGTISAFAFRQRENCARDISWGVKAAGVKGSQPRRFHVSIVWRFWELQPPGSLRDCPDFYGDTSTFTWIMSQYYILDCISKYREIQQHELRTSNAQAAKRTLDIPHTNF